MKTKHLFLAVLALAFASCCCNQDKKPQQLTYGADVSDAFDMARLNRIDSAFQWYVDEGYMPHAVTMVVHKGRVVHNKAYGWRDKEAGIPVQTTDIFRMASQTKAIACVAFMTLFEEGKVQLDEPVTKYLPEFANPVVLETYDAATGEYTARPAKSEIKIRHLITHTSGLSYGGHFMKICKAKGVHPLCSLDSIDLRENVRRMGDMPLAHDPGEGFTYSMNIDVLGAIAEVITGQDFYTFIKERVLDPLGMTETAFYLPEDRVERLVRLYEYPKGGKLQLSKHYLYQTYPYAGAQTLYAPGAGLTGPIEDYAKFCQMVINGGEFNGKRILGRKTLEMMQKNGTGDMRGEIGFGMAWDVFTPENAHNTIVSEGSMRWGGMFGTDYIIDPSEDLILLMYVNNMPNISGYNAKTLMHNTVYQALK